ncbi:MAG TPA: hypothetical protein VFL14_10675 [Xanthomonadales bacterium]|nr:hypothetical protein [Xanthomonadales bacterium]
MGRGREATRRRHVDLDALREALDDARAPRPRLQAVPEPPTELVDYDARAALAWRARPRFGDVPEDPRRRRLILLLIALAHIALLLALRHAMDLEPVPFAPAARETVLEITFDAPPPPPMTEVTAAPEERVVPVEVPTNVPHVQPPPRVVAPPRTAAPRNERMGARFIEEEPPPIRLFNSDGSVRISQEVLDASARKPEPGFKVPEKETPEFMKHKRAISDERTRFEKYWVPDDENLGQKIVRKFPPAALILQGVNLPKCKARSNAPECDDQPLPQQFDDIIPNDISEDPGIPR